MRTITPEQANKAWDILVLLAGARDDERGWNRDGFVIGVATGRHPTDEYRFQGRLGFGGKFRNDGNNNDIPYVDCYPEDLTPEGERVIAETNAALVQLFAQESRAA